MFHFPFFQVRYLNKMINILSGFSGLYIKNVLLLAKLLERLQKGRVKRMKLKCGQ